MAPQPFITIYHCMIFNQSLSLLTVLCGFSGIFVANVLLTVHIYPTALWLIRSYKAVFTRYFPFTTTGSQPDLI